MGLFFRQHGDNEHTALIILHGLLGSSSNWQSQARRFAQHRSVYVLDLPNHGQSPWSDEMDYNSMAMDVKAFIESIAHPNIILLGHSMGGKVAMTLALKYPDIIGKLIVADIAPVAYEHDFDQLIKAMLALDLSQISSRTQADSLLKKSVSEASVRAFLLHNLTHDKVKEAWIWRCNLKVLLSNMPIITGFNSMRDNIYAKPTLFIKGAQSNYVLDDHSPLIKQHFPMAHFEELANAGHWLHAEQPKTFLQCCEQFLSYAH